VLLQASWSDFLISERAHEEDPFSLEIDLNDVSRRKKFLA
jgi:hypothetical protein